MRAVLVSLLITSLLFGQFKTDVKKKPTLVSTKAPTMLPVLDLNSLDTNAVNGT